MDLIRKINDKLSLVYDNGLHIKSDGKIITSNLYEIGTLTNGLLPLYYKNENKRKGSFSYLDCSTNKLFPIDNVRWISGFHFTGSDLNYIDHNYRTNPLENFMEYHSFRSDSKDVLAFFEGKKGVSIEKIIDRKYDPETDKFIEYEGRDFKINNKESYEFFNTIKYLRIVGVGNTETGPDMLGSHFELDKKTVYSPSRISLSPNGKYIKDSNGELIKNPNFVEGMYGVVDVRTNKLLLDCVCEKINIFPGFIEYQQENKTLTLKYSEKL